MKQTVLEKYLPNSGAIAYGCMGLGGRSAQNSINSDDKRIANAAIDTAMECGIRLFDHADIYRGGGAEAVFGSVLNDRADLRRQIYLQSKCGIRFASELGPKRYDFSAAWVTSSVEGCLSRLQVENIDVLLLHRPDPLLELDELAAALIALRASGKVNYFGVSNMHSYQIERLQTALDAPLIVNQMEMSLNARAWLEEGIMAGNAEGARHNFGLGLVDYCQQHDIQLQAWGCLAQGLYSGGATNDEASANTAGLVKDLAKQYATSAEAIALAWLLRHPAAIQAVIGTTNIERIRACCEARKIDLSREHWYALWVSARGEELP